MSLIMNFVIDNEFCGIRGREDEAGGEEQVSLRIARNARTTRTTLEAYKNEQLYKRPLLQTCTARTKPELPS